MRAHLERTSSERARAHASSTTRATRNGDAMPRGDVAAVSRDRPSSRGVGTSREPRKAREERNRAAPPVDLRASFIIAQTYVLRGARRGARSREIEQRDRAIGGGGGERGAVGGKSNAPHGVGVIRHGLRARARF